MRFGFFFLVIATLAGSLLLRAEVQPQNFDLSARPEDDFYQYVNGGWLKRTPVPPIFGSYGAGREVFERNEAALRLLAERAAAKGDRAAGVERLVGDFYAAGINEAAVNAAGLAPLQDELKLLTRLRTDSDLRAAFARLQALGVPVGFSFGPEQDPKNPAMMIAAVGQGGFGLPDRDYYFRTDERSRKTLVQYAAHIARMLELAGDKPRRARTAAEAVLRLETRIAEASRTLVALRDPVANYHKLPSAGLVKLSPRFGWEGFFAVIGTARPAEIDVRQPEFFEKFDSLFAGADKKDWADYLRWQLVHGYAPFLSAPFVEEDFAFYGRALTGTTALKERWQHVLDSADFCVGEALAQLYVVEHFPPAAKARMLELVGHLQVALRTSLQTLPWMDDATRARALAKLEAFTVKIGYPDKWIDYSTLKFDRTSYAGNVRRALQFEFRRQLAKLGRPVDREEWNLTLTTDAHYSRTLNEIVFPAGILQPPFFDPQADDAVNYGAIGAIIGHEMMHAFDDRGRRYGADGTLTDWWTPESAQRFLERSTAIVRQFSGYSVLDGLHINGELTQGENLADLGGMKLAYAALRRAIADRPRVLLDGFTPEQRFFLSYASIWRRIYRPEALRLQLQTDPHSPPKFRVNGPLSNLDEFFAAFGVPEGAPMRRPAAERVNIW